MKRGRRISHIMCCTLLACAALPALTGCNAEEKAMARAFLLEYMADEYGVDASDGIGVMDLIGLGGTFVNQPEKISEAKAAMDAYTVIDTINKADKQMDAGRAARIKGDHKAAAKQMDAAIKMRPGDWTYRVSKASLAVEMGDIDEAQAQFEAADAASQSQNVNMLHYHTKQIDELFESTGNYVDANGPTVPNEKCDPLLVAYGRLATEYRSRAEEYRTRGLLPEAQADEDTARLMLTWVENIENGQAFSQ